MASQAWLESSLRRSASLGLEVLERASRRSVDWTSTGTSQTPTTTDEDAQIPVEVPACFLHVSPIINEMSILMLLLFFISAYLLSVCALLSFFRELTQSLMMSSQPSRTSWHRRPISARSVIICLHPSAFSCRSVLD